MIETKTHFKEQRVTSDLKVLPGNGSVVVDVPFVPDYIKVKFLDTQLRQAQQDTISYSLLFTGTATIPAYQLTVNWSVGNGQARRLRYTAAKLSSFHNGVK